MKVTMKPEDAFDQIGRTMLEQCEAVACSPSEYRAGLRMGCALTAAGRAALEAVDG